VGTVGPAPDGTDFEQGWKIADELKVPVVDEHYYQQPSWFLNNLSRYDSYDRARSHVYLGEYASRSNTFGSALAEAAYMCNLERNGDVVRMASYAPLLARIGHTQWNPDLIYFNGTTVYPTVNYYVQQLFGNNSGDRYVSSTVERSPKMDNGQALACSTVQDSRTGDLILKVANVSPARVTSAIRFEGAPNLAGDASVVVLTGDPKGQDSPAHPTAILPVTSTMPVSPRITYDAPANSLTVIRVRTVKAAQ
jgi:alpha-L-arabinofuranosidase